jgi:hypothetical protein
VPTIRAGNRTTDLDDALQFARRYLHRTDEHYWAYPAYDSYQATRATDPLIDADLLAPVLLNVQHLDLPTYYHLLSELPNFQRVLDDLPPTLSLFDANDKDLALIGQLFAGIDARRLPGASGTTVSKVLHRKRPALVPLYDDHVRACYQDGPGAPVPRVKGRTWAEFMPAFARAVQEDLISQAAAWQQITELATGPAITPLRALDIVAWWLGRSA